MQNYLFLSAQFIPHGYCYLWQTGLVWLQRGADFLIAIASFSMTIVLFYFFRQQQENLYEKILVLFSLFIFSCGTTHLISIWTLWHPDYWISGTIKAITAKSKQDVLNGYRLQASCYIIKPSDLQAFLAAIRQIENFWFSCVELPQLE